MNATDWLQDFSDCVAGEHGPEAQRVADEWMEDNWGLPEGQGWRRWRDFRQTWSPAPVSEADAVGGESRG